MITGPKLKDAVSSLYPNANWIMRGNNYEGLEWHEPPVREGGQKKPTQEEVEAEVARLQQEWENNQYQRDRAKKYPSIQDQLDTLYHQGYDGWKAMVNEVKNKYPKPE